MRAINEIILHCTDTAATAKPESIRRNHIEVRGWRDCGYHYLIDNKGKCHKMRPLELVGAHCLGHNRGTVGVAYIGKHINAKQIQGVIDTCRMLKFGYGFGITKITRHCDYDKHKTCPNLTAQEYQTILKACEHEEVQN